MNQAGSLSVGRVAASGHQRRRPYVVAVIAALGFAAATVQLVMIRELINAFAGDELTVGIALSCWLVLSAVGTWWGSLGHAFSRPIRLLASGTIAVVISAIGAVLMLRGARDQFLLRGTAVDPMGMAIVCLCVMAPFCLGSGALLTLACRVLSREDDVVAIGRVYAADAVGSVIGAATFTFLFSQRLDHVATLLVTTAVIGGVAAVIGWRRRSRVLFTTALITMVVAGSAAAWGNLDRVSTQWQFRSPVVFRTSSPYGRLVVTRTAGELTFFENGLPTVFTANAIQSEEIVHYGLAQRPAARSVLIIGGGIAGSVSPVLQYREIRSVTCIEIDPAIVDAARKLLPHLFVDPRVRFIATDARRYLEQTADRFDAILVALPDPTTYQLNRYYTAEFFSLAKRRLSADGVLSIGCGHFENYISPELQALIASARSTLQRAFQHVLVIPGGRVYFVGSDAPLESDVATAIERAGVAPVFVKRSYLDATLTPDRLANVEGAAVTAGKINRDFRPMLYLLRLRRWLQQFSFPAGGFAVGLALVVLISYVQLRAVPRMIFAAGFAASALEVVLLIAVQTYYGAMYRQVGAVVAAFMGGLALGAAVANRRPRVPALVRRLAVAIAAVAAALAVGLPHLGKLNAWFGAQAGQVAILAVTVLLAAMVGAQFSCGSAGAATVSARTAPRFFSADLIGAAVGGLAASAFLLPAFGVATVCLLTAGLNLVAAGLSWGLRPDA